MNFFFKVALCATFLGTAGEGKPSILGKTCVFGKIYMYINDQLRCDKCHRGQYWSWKEKECLPCTHPEYTNLRRNILTSCKDHIEIPTPTPVPASKPKYIQDHPRPKIPDNPDTTTTPPSHKTHQYSTNGDTSSKITSAIRPTKNTLQTAVHNSTNIKRQNVHKKAKNSSMLVPANDEKTRNSSLLPNDEKPRNSPIPQNGLDKNEEKSADRSIIVVEKPVFIALMVILGILGLFAAALALICLLKKCFKFRSRDVRHPQHNESRRPLNDQENS